MPSCENGYYFVQQHGVFKQQAAIDRLGFRLAPQEISAVGTPRYAKLSQIGLVAMTLVCLLSALATLYCAFLDHQLAPTSVHQACLRSPSHEMQHDFNELLQSLLDGSPRKQLKPGRQRLMEGSSLKSTVDGV